MRSSSENKQVSLASVALLAAFAAAVSVAGCFCDPDEPEGFVYACNESLDCPEGTMCLLCVQGQLADMRICGPFPPNSLCMGFATVPDAGTAACGNGEVDFGEQCDDGNSDPGDGCDDECARETSTWDTGADPATSTIHGSEPSEQIGRSDALAVGDFNDDGFDDVLIGSRDFGTSGRAYVMLGAASFPPQVDLGADAWDILLAAANPGDALGTAVAAGDVTGDGIDDAIVTAVGADEAGTNEAGEVYIIPGSDSLVSNASIDVDSARTTVIFGAAAGDGIGAAVAIGDVDGDGVDDVILSGLRPNDDGFIYVVFGGSALEAGGRIPLDTPGDFLMSAIPLPGAFGTPVAAGDVTGDSVDDIFAGASTDSPSGRSNAGTAHLIAGAKDLTGALTPDVSLLGADAGDQLGDSGALIDLNGDGIADFVTGASDADGPDNLRAGAGELAIYFGRPNLPMSGTVDLSLTLADLTVYGMASSDRLGLDLHGEDLDADGTGDLIIGVPQGDGPGDARMNTGEVYVLYGFPGFGGTETRLDLADDPPHLTVYGAATDDAFGTAVAAGDVNGDGVTDIVVGAQLADGPGGGRSNAGAIYVLVM